MAVIAAFNVFAQSTIFSGDFETGDLTDYSLKNPGAGIEITQESTNGGDYAVKLTAGSGTNAWDLQLATPSIPLTIGNKYEVSFDIRSVGAGQGRISLGASSFTHQYWPDFNTTDEWQTITYTAIYGADLEALLDNVEINFDLGYIADMVYYLDNIKVVDLDAEPPVTDYITNGTFESGIEGWAKWNGSDNALSHATASEYAVKLTAGTGTNAWDLQLATPSIPLTVGNLYEVSFDIRSTGAGQGRISLGATSFTHQYWPDFTTSEEWQTVSYTAIYGADLEALLDNVELNFDIGYIANMVYYIDNIKVTDLTAQSDVFVGDFEAGNIDNFNAKNPGAGIVITQESTNSPNVYEGGGAMKVINETSTPGQQWNVQIHTDFTATLTEGVDYTVSYYIRSESAGSVRCSTTGTTAHYQGDQATTTEWQLVTWDITGNGTETGLNFDLGEVAGTYYIDNVSTTEKVAVVSNDATLSDLTVDGATITDFDPDVTSYNVVLAAGTTTVPTVEATATNGAATVSVTPAPGIPGIAHVLVTAEDASTKTYVINFSQAFQAPNIFTAGDFESGDLSSFNIKNAGAGIEITQESTNGGDYAAKLTAGSGTNAWDLQLATASVPLIVGHKYEVSFDIRSVGAGQGRISLGGASFSQQYWPDFTTSDEWQTISYTAIYGEDLVALLDNVELNFDLGYIADMVYYLDNVSIVDLDAEAPPLAYIANGTFESGLDGWAKWNGGDNALSLASGSAYAVKLTASSASANDWDLQLATPSIPLTVGNLYEVSFDVRSTGDGTGRISLGANSFANQYWPNFTTSNEWQTITYTEIYGADLEALLDNVELNFDMGTIADMTYYIDNIKVTDLTASTDVFFGDFESGNIDNYIAKNPGAGIEITQESTYGGSAYEGMGAMKVVNETSTPGEQWNVQIHADLTRSLDKDVTYVVSYYIRSDSEGSVRCSTSGPSAHYQPDAVTTTDWQMVSWEIVAHGLETGLNFDLGEVAGTYYIDNVSITEKPIGPSDDATLSDLTVNGSTVEGFTSDIESYDVVLPFGTDTVPTVEATTTDDGATYIITAATTLPGTTTVAVTAEDGTTIKTYSLNFTVADPSTDATLSDLTVDGSTVGSFSSETVSYDVVLPYGTDAVPTVDATTTDSNASYSVTPAAGLPGTTEVVVTAEDGTTLKTYSINFTVADPATDASLSDLTVDGSTVSGFNSGTLSYAIKLPVGSTEVPDVSATTTDPNATFSVDPAASLPGTTTVTVTAEDGTTQATYSIDFSVLSDDATLSDLTMDGTTVSGFSAGITWYDIELPIGTTTIPTVSATATNGGATVEITPATSIPGRTQVLVTAEDGATFKTYSLYFTVNVLSTPKTEHIQLYPNPTSNILNISGLEKPASAKIVNVSGKVIQQFNNLKNQQIDVSSVEPGVYYFIIDNKETLRFIKK